MSGARTGGSRGLTRKAMGVPGLVPGSGHEEIRDGGPRLQAQEEEVGYGHGHGHAPGSRDADLQGIDARSRVDSDKASRNRFLTLCVRDHNYSPRGDRLPTVFVSFDTNKKAIPNGMALSHRSRHRT